MKELPRTVTGDRTVILFETNQYQLLEAGMLITEGAATESTFNSRTDCLYNPAGVDKPRPMSARTNLYRCIRAQNTPPRKA
jgi:hypothetical protein